MLSLPTDFAAALAGGSTSLCGAFEIERVDGTVIRLTNAQQAFTADGETFTPAPGFNVGALRLDANGASGDLAVEIASYPGALIETADLLDGLYDGAAFRYYLADYENPAFGLVAKWRGWVDAIETTDRHKSRLTIRGLLARTHFMVTETYSAACRAFWADSRCGINAASFTHTATVVSVSGRTVVLSVVGTPSRSFALGSIVATSGRAKGKRLEIYSWNSGSSTAVMFMPFLNLAPGDAVQIMPGCAYNVEACVGWNNIRNYRGEPYAFGQDAVAAIFPPTAFADPATSPAQPGRVPNGDLVVIDQSSSTLTLQFSDYGSASDYYYQYRIDGGEPQTLAGPRVVTGLDPSTTYQVEVRPVAYAGDIVGDWSNVASGTTEPAGDAVGIVVRLTGPEVFGSIRSGIEFVTPALGEFGFGTDQDFDLPPDGFTTGDFPEDFYGNHILHQSGGGQHGDVFYINVQAIRDNNPGLTEIVFDFTTETATTSTPVTWDVYLHGGGDLTIAEFGAHMWDKYSLEPGIYTNPDQMLYRLDGLVDVLDSVSGSGTASVTPSTWRITVDLETGTVTQS
jgi:uncharacterized phage protein (TIGR02218 family)